MLIDFKEVLDEPNKIRQISVASTIKLNYKEFIENIEFIKKIFGEKCRCLFSGKNAYIVFMENDNILFSIKNIKGYNKEDFRRINLDFIYLTGTDNKQIKNFKRMLIEDICNNFWQILVLMLIYILIFRIMNTSIDILNKLNDTLINVTSIFISALLVFVTLFYDNKDKLRNLIRQEKFDKYFNTDKYIFTIAMTTLFIIILSNGITHINCSYEIILNIKEYLKVNIHWLYLILRFEIPYILTGTGVMLIFICVTSIKEYYLESIKVDAFQSILEEFRNNKK